VRDMKPQLLLVDDEPDVLDMLEDVLGDEYAVLKATSAKEAIDIVHREAGIKLAVIDYMMPGGNGIRLARAMVETKRGIPMLIFSAYLPSGMREWAGDLKLRVLAKTEGPEALSRAVREMLTQAAPSAK
jgi:CheY-like chemotaxis protein